jgi:hypothetical protein
MDGVMQMLKIIPITRATTKTITIEKRAKARVALVG